MHHACQHMEIADGKKKRVKSATSRLRLSFLTRWLTRDYTNLETNPHIPSRNRLMDNVNQTCNSANKNPVLVMLPWPSLQKPGIVFSEGNQLVIFDASIHLNCISAWGKTINFSYMFYYKIYMTVQTLNARKCCHVIVILKVYRAPSCYYQVSAEGTSLKNITNLQLNYLLCRLYHLAISQTWSLTFVRIQ